MKDEKTMKVGERFSYDGIDVQELRNLPKLPEWLRQNKRARARILYDPTYIGDVPPGHPRSLCYRPENWKGDTDFFVIPDPENIAYASIEYGREKKYEPELWLGGKEVLDNRYYVVSSWNFKKLWKPLPWNSLRMQCWEVSRYAHLWHQYLAHDNKEMFSHPMPDYKSQVKKVYPPKIDEHWKDEYIAQVMAEYEVAKAVKQSERQAELEEHAQYASKYATPERHMAVREIRKFFREYQPRLDLIENPQASSVYGLIGGHSWFYRYASPEDYENDPLVEEHRPWYRKGNL